MTLCKIGGRRRALGLLALAASLGGATVVSGCESGDSSAVTPSATATTSSPSPSASSPSPSPSPTPSSDIPAAAREKSDAGAEAFVRYFFDQVNEAWTTPRAGLIAAVSDPSCEFCNRTEATAESLVAEGQAYEDVPVTLGETGVLAGAPNGQKYVSLGLTQNKSRILDKDGAVVDSDPEATVRFNAALTWTTDGWLMLGVEKG